MSDDLVVGPLSKRLYLIDGTSQLFRAYFAIPALSNDEGLPTNAVYGFTTMLRKLLKEEGAEYVAAAFDLGRDVFRHETFAAYKANRPPVPEDLRTQLPFAKTACAVMGVHVLEKSGYEADDLIATYARAAREAGFEVVVVASDKDLLQLVDRGVSVLNPVKDVRLDARGVLADFGVPPEKVCDVLGLMGDSVDNVPGVPGVGEKSALSVISTYGSVEQALERAGRFVAVFDARDELLDALGELEGEAPGPPAVRRAASAARRLGETFDALLEQEADEGYRERLAAAGETLAQADLGGLEEAGEGRVPRKVTRLLKRELKGLERGSARRMWYAIHEHAAGARMSKELVTLRRDVPVELDPEELRRSVPDAERVRAFFRSMGFRSLLADPDGDGADARRSEAGPAERAARYPRVGTRQELERVAAEARGSGRVAVEATGEGSDLLGTPLTGLALAWGDGVAAYVPVGHASAAGAEEPDLGAVRDVLGPVLTRMRPVGHDVKRQMHLLRRHGIDVADWALDTMVASFLLDSSRTDFTLARLAETYLGQGPTRSGPARGRNASLLPPSAEEGASAAEAADFTLRLADRLAPLLEQQGLRRLYDTIDGPLLPVLARMETHGIRVDRAALEAMSRSMQTALDEARVGIHSLAGTEFNIDSPKQLREVLFDRLKLQPRRKTAKSKVASTDAQTLEDLAAEHAIARRVLEYRELAKLKGTYVDALPRLVRRDTGRLHTCFHPTGAATGRISSSDPNLQNIPVRSAAGRQIRSAFVPEPGYRFLAADYSQIELRVLARLAEDDELIAAFRAGEDIHRYTASRVFGVPIEGVTDTMRRRAKAVNFGIIYGMSEIRLAREQGMQRAEARRFIRTYFERFAGVRRYIDEVRERARRDGAVRTMFGRIRHFPQLHQRVNRGVQEQALRAAVNHTIQGTAADLMKMAMLRVDAELRRRSIDARILLQVHDELLLEVVRGREGEVGGLVGEAMERVHDLGVPLAVDQKVGESWLEVT